MIGFEPTRRIFWMSSRLGTRRELQERVEQVAGVVRAGAGLGVVLDRAARNVLQRESLDRPVEGLALKDVAGCTVQYHPEAGPGPHDARYLFDAFLELAARA